MSNFLTAVTILFSFSLCFASSVFQKEIPENKKGRSAYEKKEYSNAEDHFSSGLERKNNPELFYNLGNSLYRQNKKDKALEAYKKALENNPRTNLRSDILSNMGNVFAEKQKFDKAASLYERSLKIRPDRDTASNLEIVRRLLQQQKQEQERKDEQDNQEKDENQEQCEQDKGDEDKDDEKDKDEGKKDKEEDKRKPEDDKEKDEEAAGSEKSAEKTDEKTDMKNILREFKNRKNLQITPFMLKEEGKTEEGQRW